MNTNTRSPFYGLAPEERPYLQLVVDIVREIERLYRDTLEQVGRRGYDDDDDDDGEFDHDGLVMLDRGNLVGSCTLWNKKYRPGSFYRYLTFWPHDLELSEPWRSAPIPRNADATAYAAEMFLELQARGFITASTTPLLK